MDALLTRYWQKRDFSATPEPRGEPAARRAGDAPAFVIQKHHASSLHYDFRLEVDGVMKSWAVPKGPSYDPSVKRMAVQVEDHPVSYNTFEGTIPPGQYGAGTVQIWDRGTWEPLDDPRRGLRDGKLAFRMHGHKMHGTWELVRMKWGSQKKAQWLLFKKHDEFERSSDAFDVLTAWPDSVVSRKPPDAAKIFGKAPAAKSSAKPPPKAALPRTLSPQLATLAAAPPDDGGDWVYEVKFDGYRILARFANGKPRLLTRRGHDWTDRMPELAARLGELGIESAWLDGEVVMLDEQGIPHFNALQNAFDTDHTARLVYYVFDLPYANGHDLRALPLRERKAALAALLGKEAAAGDRGLVRLSIDAPGEGAALLKEACRRRLEGLIAKRADAPYRSTRTDDWRKLKCTLRQEFVIGGFTDRKGEAGAAGIGSLLLGVHDADGQLVYAGSVGTGWNQEVAADLKRRLVAIETNAVPFVNGVQRSQRWANLRATSGAPHRWVKPRLVAEVSFAEWTPDGRIRHASYEGLRADKPPAAITRERAA